MLETNDPVAGRPGKDRDGELPRIAPDGSSLPGGSFHEGRWQNPEIRRDARNLEDGSVLGGGVRSSTSQDVKRAITHIRLHLRVQDWPLQARRGALQKLVLLLGEQIPRFARIIAGETSKTTIEAELEVRHCIETLRLSAATSEELAGDVPSIERSHVLNAGIGGYSREPICTIAAITPAHDQPLNSIAKILGPALIGGNGLVLRLPERTPLGGLALVELLLESGVPKGRIAALISGPGVFETLVADERVKVISYAGGSATAGPFASAEGAVEFPAELNGNDAAIVCSDADPLEAAAAIVCDASGGAGQNGFSVQRVYAHISVFDQVLEYVIAGTKALRTGLKYDRASHIGAPNYESTSRRLEEWVEEAREAGARLHAGGRRHGAFYEPTVLTDVASSCRVIREEVPGPVLSVLPFIELQDAVYEVNNTGYGRQVEVFMNSIDLALAIAGKLHVGSVVISQAGDAHL